LSQKDSGNVEFSDCSKVKLITSVGFSHGFVCHFDTTALYTIKPWLSNVKLIDLYCSFTCILLLFGNLYCNELYFPLIENHASVQAPRAENYARSVPSLDDINQALVSFVVVYVFVSSFPVWLFRFLVWLSFVVLSSFVNISQVIGGEGCRRVIGWEGCRQVFGWEGCCQVIGWEGCWVNCTSQVIGCEDRLCNDLL